MRRRGGCDGTAIRRISPRGGDTPCAIVQGHWTARWTRFCSEHRCAPVSLMCRNSPASKWRAEGSYRFWPIVPSLRNQIPAISATPPAMIDQLIQRILGVCGRSISWLESREKLLHARLSAVNAIEIPSAINSVAIACASQGGWNAPNTTWKPIPIPIAANAVRSQPAKVRSVAWIVRSSARSVRNSAHSALFSESPLASRF